MTPNELKNTIGVTKTIKMVGEALGLHYYPDCDDMWECCKNNKPGESDNIVFWYNSDSDSFVLKLTKSVYQVDYIEMDAIIDYINSFIQFNKALKTSYMVQEITKDF